MRHRLAPTAALAAALALSGCSRAPAVEYPPTRTVDQVDDYHGVSVADPYRWLEDDTASEVVDWVKAENAVTFAYLDRIPFRASMKQRLEQLMDYPRYGAPSRHGDYYFFSKNDGLQNQSVLYVQKGIDGTPEVLLDPNTFSDDGTTTLSAFSPSRDGTYVVYGESVGGSDWSEYHVMEVATRRTLPDVIRWVKVSDAAWAGDGFFYSRYPEPAPGEELTSKNENHQVWFHRLGTTQDDDQLVFEDAAYPQRFNILSTTDDERYAILDVSDRGSGKKGNAVFFRDLTRPDRAFTPLVGEITDDEYSVIDRQGDAFLVQTNHGAPNGRVVRIDPRHPDESSWVDVLPERAQALQSARTAGGKLFATYLEDVATKAYAFDPDGTNESEIALPGVGSAGGFGGLPDDTFVFYTFTSFNYPPTIFKYDIATGASSEFRRAEVPGFSADDYEVKQVFATSKDGTRIPMFLTYRKGLQLDGRNPTLLYGYGGFNISLGPGFSAQRVALLENGFVFAQANLRGGGEYGESWHEAGMKLNKQNVFDDFIACAEWLVANGYTSKEKLALQGGSNGGLLVAAVTNQRPDLASVVVAQAGVMDMLRFQKWTIGWNWIADYGSSDDPEQFKALYAYSPVHNVRKGTHYPAVFITTADHDDRVVPAHSFKYAAAMQAAQAGDAPILIRVETNSAHGASSTEKSLEINADVYSFLFYNLGVTPKAPSGP
jgi:prolyl oligopeptidase